MSNTKESLTKVLSDLIGNRGNLAAQINQQEVELDVRKSQLDHFDVVIAAVKVNLAADAAAFDALVVAEMLKPDLLSMPEVPAAPLAPAGDDQAAAGQTPAVGTVGTDANGSPVE